MESNKNSVSARSSRKEINFQWFFVNFFIHWKWFLLSIILFLLFGFLRLRYSVPVYNVNARVVLKDSKRGGPSNSELTIFENMNILESSKNIENEIEVLGSRNLIENVVIAQEFYIRYLIKGKFKDTDLYGNENRIYYSSTPIKAFVDTTVISTLQTVILLKVSLDANDAIQVNGFYGGKEFSGTYSSFPAVVMTPIGELLLLASETSTLRAEYPLEIHIIPPLWIAQQYLGALSLELTGKNTTVVKLSLSETNRKRGEDFLFGLVDLYNRDAMDDKNKAANSASQFIDERLINLSFDLASAEKEVETYKRQNDILNLESESELIIGGSGEYEKKLVEIGTKKLLLSFLSDEFDKNEENSQLLPASLANSLDATLASSLEKHNQLILERARLTSLTDEESPIIKRMDEQLRTLKVNIKTSLQSVQYALAHQQKEYETLRDLYDVDRQGIPRKERELTDIIRQQIIKANLFVDLLRRREEIALTLAVTAPSAKILESPLSSPTPIAPRKMWMYMMCLLGGVVFPFVVIGIRELFNYKITNEDEVRRYLDVPVIVSIPMVKTKDTLIITPHSTTAIAERFRLLRINLQHVLDSP
ncbi:MAG: hypothetical protein LBE13_18985, partial [Bacteroidales bacterium]|nr:hypothetical protein [Bacteroidales bacterium]